MSLSMGKMSMMKRLTCSSLLALVMALGLSAQDRAVAQSNDGPTFDLPRVPGVGAVPSSGSTSVRGAITVGPKGRFKSIRAAVQALGPGATLSVAPGTYSSSLVLTEPVSIIAQTPASDNCTALARCTQIIPDDNKVCITIRMKKPQDRVRLSGLKITPKGSYRSQPCIILEQGYLVLENSIIQSTKHYPVVVLRGGESRIQNNDIQGGLVGVQVDVASRSVLGEEAGHYLIGNRIENNETGLRVNYSTKTFAFLNLISNNSTYGIAVYDGGGYYAANGIGGNGQGGIYIGPNDQGPIFASNTINFNGASAITTHAGERAQFQSNTICGNGGLAFSTMASSLEQALMNPALGNIVFDNPVGSNASGGLFRRSRNQETSCPSVP